MLFHHGGVESGGAGKRRVLAIVARFLLCCGGQLARRAQLWCRVLWWTVVAGRLLLVELVCGETQEEQLSGVSRDILSDVECPRGEPKWPQSLDSPMQFERSTIGEETSGTGSVVD